MSERDFDTCWCGNRAVLKDRITLREYCLDCALSPKRSSEDVYRQFLDALVPFAEGDQVDCFQAGDIDRYVGNGKIIRVSTDLEEGGTPTYPVYQVEFSEDTTRWFTAICLKRTHPPAK